MTGLDVLRWAAAIYLAVLLAGVSGLAVYAALFWTPTAVTPRVGRVVYWLGHVVVYAAGALVVGAIVGAGVAVGLAVFAR